MNKDTKYNYILRYIDVRLILLNLRGSDRQVIDIPEIKPKVTEHQVFKKTCKCGHQNLAEYPHRVKAPVSYGGNIESLIGYFHTRQYVPFKRMQEIFNN